MRSFDFTNKANIGRVPSLEEGIKHRFYPPAFTHVVTKLQNHSRDLDQREHCVSLELRSTEPAVKIPVNIIDYGMMY